MAKKKETVPDFLKNDVPEMPQDSLAKLAILVDRLTEAENDVVACENALTLAKERRSKLAGAPMVEGEIPQLVLQLGITEIRLRDGRKVEVKPDISASIVEGKEEKFFTFLASRKEDDIVKLHFDFAKMPGPQQKRLYQFLMAGDYQYDSKKDVHWQTLKKYVREFLLSDSNNEKLLKGMVTVYKYATTKVK